jgi:Domain of unknown function (DUF5060)/Secretion system C-terminal sorting domain
VKRVFLIISLAVFISPLLTFGQAPSNIIVTPVATTVSKFDKFEITVSLTAGYINPYDYADISIHAAFTAPSGRIDTVDGFFMQDYTLNTTNGSLTADGTGNFKVRYSPNETGTWQYYVIATNTAGTANSMAQNFQCNASSEKGFIRKNSSNYLGFDNNEQFIPVGQNQAWHQTNPYVNYKLWLQKLSDNKANMIRIWQAVWGFGIEWKNGVDGYSGIEKYKQTSSYYLDWLLNEAKNKGVYIMFCINHHGMVSSNVNPNWPDNPYNAANGGPCVNTWDFFTNSVAKNLHKNRLRYIIARWGYSENIMSWELFNEVDWTDNFSMHKDEVKNWHIEMADYIKTIDINKHLVTTSYANNTYDPNTWASSSIDFTQVHNYIGSPNVENALAGAVADYVSQYNKPAINGEYGIDANNVSLSTIDPNGIYIHNSIWATAFSGAMGAGMSWWWDNYIDPQNLYHYYKPLSELLATIALKDDNYKKNASTTTGGGTSDLILTPGIGFALAGASSFTIDATGTVTPSASQLSGYLFGQFNSQYKSPPTFMVTYPVTGQFKVQTGSSISASGAKINVYLNGISVLDQTATINTTYTINVPAGSATIKVDNLGLDWVTISNYTFVNIGPPLNTYFLKSTDSKKAAGWVHNKKYNWQYVKDNGMPSAITGATLTIPNMENGSYMVRFTDCNTGAVIGNANATASGNNLAIPLPTVVWDIAVTAVWGGVTPLIDPSEAGEFKIYPNPVTKSKLYISYDLRKPAVITIELFDIKGNKIVVIFNGEQSAGSKLTELDAAAVNIAAGTYVLKFTIGKRSVTKKIVIYK